MYKNDIKKLEEEIISKQEEIKSVKSNVLNNVKKLEGNFKSDKEEFQILSHIFSLNHNLDISHSFLVELKNTRTKNLSKKGDEPKMVQVKFLTIYIVNDKSSTTYWADKEIPGYGTANLGIESFNEPIAEELKKLL